MVQAPRGEALQIALLSHSSMTGPVRVGSHHLARELARRGHVVSHTSTPVTVAHVMKARQADVRVRARRALRPVRDPDGVVHAVALAPLPLRPTRAGPIGAIGRATARRIATRVRHHHPGGGDQVRVDQPLRGEAACHVGARALVYRPTDMHSAGRTAEAERRLVPQVDAVVATSPVVLESLGRAATAVPNLVLENGVEHGRFAASGPEERERAGVVYAGAIDYRFDWGTVVAIATANANEVVTLIGPVTTEPPSLPRNVRLEGPVPYADLPARLRAHRVAMLPLSGAGINQGRSPMKYFEYQAAGLWVAASRTPTTERLAAPGVELFDDPCGAGDAVARLLTREGPNDRGVSFAIGFDWSARAATLETFVRELL
jgi:hypothetical protein